MPIAQRRFGRTGLTIPHITLGGGWVGGLLIHGTEEQRFKQLDDAMAAGVDWVDTAALYGQGQSEQRIGEWMAATGSRPRLSTKFSVDVWAGDLEGQVRRSLDASFSRLGVSRVEAVLLHNQIAEGDAPGSFSGLSVENVLGDGGVADIMDKLRSEGLMDHIGFTALGEPEATKAIASSGRMDVTQVYYNMLNATADEPAPAGWSSTDFAGLLHDCKAQDMGVMGIRIFAGGYLATDRRHGREIPITVNAEDAAETARVAAISDILDGEAGDRAQHALRFGLASDLLSTIVIGVGEDWHFAHAVDAVEIGPLSQDALGKLADVRRTNAAFVG
ncbi:MAG: aldo/keto reductase [Pseudomonadota bacterium]